MKKNASVEDFFAKVCLEHELTASEHFLRVKKKKEMPDSKFFVPQRTDLIDNYASHDIIEICAKTLYQLELNRINVDTMWGFSIEAELVENKDKQDELCCFVSRVEERSVASGNGMYSLHLDTIRAFFIVFREKLFLTVKSKKCNYW